MKILQIIKDKFLLEHLQISEITLDSSNAVEVSWSSHNIAQFTVGGVTYEAYFDELVTPIKLPKSDSDFIYSGVVFNVGFGVKGDDPFAVSSSLPKGGRANLVKIYSTMFKVIEEFVKNNKPDYILLSAYAASNYFPIYNNLTKTNKIVGYQRKMVDSWEMDGAPIQSIVLKNISK